MVLLLVPLFLHGCLALHVTVTSRPCTRPCPAVHSKKELAEDGSKMKKPFEEMTVEELQAYMDGQWDGMVPTSTSLFDILARRTTASAAVSTTDAMHIAEATAENFASEPKPRAPEEESTAKGAAETAAVNSSELEARALEEVVDEAAYEENDAGTYVVPGPDGTSASAVIGPDHEGSTPNTSGAHGELLGRIAEGATGTAAVKPSEPESRVPEQALPVEDDMETYAERVERMAEPGAMETAAEGTIKPELGTPTGASAANGAAAITVVDRAPLPEVEAQPATGQADSQPPMDDAAPEPVPGAMESSVVPVEVPSAPKAGAKEPTLAAGPPAMETYAERVERMAEPGATEIAVEGMIKPESPTGASAANGAAAITVVDSAPLPEVEAQPATGQADSEPPVDDAAPEPVPGAMESSVVPVEVPSAPEAGAKEPTPAAGPPAAAAGPQSTLDVELLPLVSESGAAESPTGEAGTQAPQEVIQEAPQEATRERTAEGAAQEPDTAQETDKLKAELERLRAKNEALRLRADLEKLRAENEALESAARLESPRAKIMSLQREQSNASQLADEQGNASWPAEERSIASEPSKEQGAAAWQPAWPADEHSNAIQPAEEQSSATQPVEEQGNAVQLFWPAEERSNASQPAKERSRDVRLADGHGDADEPTEDEGGASHPVEKVGRADIEAVSLEPLPLVVGDEVVHSGVEERSPEEMRSESRQGLLKDVSVNDAHSDAPAEVASGISEEPPKVMTISTTHVDTPAEAASGIHQDLLKEMPVSTTHADTLAEMESRIREDVLKQIALSTTSTDNPAEKASQVREEFLKEMETRIMADILKEASTTPAERPAEVASANRKELPKEVPGQTAPTKTFAEMESRIRKVTPAEASAEVVGEIRGEPPKAVSVSTMLAETPAEMESRIREEVLKEMALGTTPAETPSEKANQMRNELLKVMATSTTPAETPAKAEFMTREELLKDLPAETTASTETQDEMTASMRAEVLRELEEESQRQKQKMEDDVRRELLGEMSTSDHVDLTGNEEDLE